MSDHTWILENLESYSAGGLEPDERERLEQHVQTCSACARALEKTRTLDQTMELLFTGVRPEAALEDRLILVLRSRSRRWFRRQMVLAAAAVILLAALGAGLGNLIERGQMPFPWTISSRLVASNNQKQLAMSVDSIQVVGESSSIPSAEQLAEQSRGEAMEAIRGSVTQKNRMDAWERTDTYVKNKITVGDAQHSSSNADLDNDGAADVARATRGFEDVDGSITADVNGTLITPAKPNQSPPVATWREITGQRKDNSASEKRASQIAGWAFSPDGKQVASGKAGGGVKLWDAQSGSKDRLNPAGGGTGTGYDLETGVSLGNTPAAGAGQQRQSGTPLSSSSFNMAIPPSAPAKPESSYRSDAPIPLGHNRLDKGGLYTFGEFIYFKPQSALAEAKKATGDNSQSSNQQFQPLGSVNAPGENKFRTGLTLGDEKKHKDDSKEATVPQHVALTPQNKPNAQPNIPPTAPPPALPRKIVIRSGEIEFEIESFDAAVAAVTKLVNQYQGGYVDTVNSDKLPNGKVRGSVVVRVPPEHLDSLLLDLRKELGKGGELKTLHVGSEDITKQYTDLESRLRAARTMEERLLEIIKTGKGEIKDLLNAEKELGVWRTRIEEFQGELNYYSNRVSLSTLTISLYEKEIRAPAALVETERVQMGIEVEDVDRAQQQVLKEVTAAKGRVTKSELRQQAAGQFSAVMNFEVPPDAAGPLRDRLRQLGNVARLEIDRLQQSEDGSGKPPTVVKSRRNDTQFILSLYNVANVAPRETIHLSMASPDVEGDYRKILTRVQKSSGRVVASNLSRQKDEQTFGTIQFEVKSAEADGLLGELQRIGEMMRLQFTENPDTANVTQSKRGFNVQLFAFGLVLPRETAKFEVASKNVPDAYRLLQEAVAKVKGRVLTAQLNEQDREDLKAQLEFDIRRSDQPAIDAVLEKIGDVYARTVTRAADADNILDSRLRMQIGLVNAARIPPRESVTLAIEVGNVDLTAGSFSDQVKAAEGRTVGSNVAHESNGRVTAKLIYDVPLARADDLLRKFTSSGVVRVLQSSRNPQVPDSPLAIARLTVTLSNAELIVPSDDGLWPQIRKGLSTSFIALSWSLTVVIVGVCFVLPWVVVAYAAYRLVARLRRGAATPA